MERFILQLKKNPYALTPIILGLIAIFLLTIGAIQGFEKVDKYLMPVIIGLLFNLIPSPLGQNGKVKLDEENPKTRKRRKKKGDSHGRR